MTARTVTTALLLMAAPLTACGGSSASSSASGAGAAPAAASSAAAGDQDKALGACGANSYPVSEPLACLSYDLTGGLTEKGTTVSSTSEAKTCADWVKGTVFGGKPVLKMPAAGGVSEGKFLGLSGTVADYTGPATYAAEKLSAVSVDLSAPARYEPGSSSTGTLTVKADGSGSFTFDGYTGTDGAPGTVSGTVTWTCHDPEA